MKNNQPTPTVSQRLLQAADNVANEAVNLLSLRGLRVTPEERETIRESIAADCVYEMSKVVLPLMQPVHKSVADVNKP